MIVVFFTATAHAQQNVFEVASVRVNPSGDARSRYPRMRNGSMTAENVRLKELLEAAYGINRMLISGPSWLDSDRFDVTAKAPEGTVDTQFTPMLRALLKDRFHLEAHRESKEMDAFDMVAAKGGAKLVSFDPARPPKQTPNTGGSAFMGAGTMADLARDLIVAAGRPVVDRTEIGGRYYWDLRYAPMSRQPADNAPGPPDVFTAMQEQLGLRLVPRKQPIEVLVVDHADRIPDRN